ncbi:MAG: lysophospholipid acyltransferase family protein, partial [Proteobacteria bacterium]|nr:lysophospholipid acyltransferase family protein [Pseudomonadota bacterium]
NKKASLQKNSISLKHAVQHVRDGGCLIIFPAGEVSHLKIREHRIIDSEWSLTVAKLVKLTKASVLPVYFHGSNSIAFQLLGLLHPWIRTILLPRELLKKINSDITLNIGQVINFNKIKNLDNKKLIKFLRISTYALSGKDNVNKTGQAKNIIANLNIIDPVPTELLCGEINHLPDHQLLLTHKKINIFYADAKQIPWVLQEIGRLRELTFREIGEGTGREIDIDIYDSYYTHLFLWDAEKNCLIGAYRIGLTDEIINRYGIKGLYSYSLFKYSERKLYELGPSLELGRSFIRSEYQRSPSSLSLLWKGIGVFIAQKARYTTLFGPVSISNDYQDISRKLIVDCLTTNRLMKEISRNIKPRKPYKSKSKTPWQKNELNILDDINLVSDIISQLEQGKRGIPILIKQYIKLGGRFLEFNVDEEFNDALDGLIVVDLRETEIELLEYFMGKDIAKSYINQITNNLPKLKQAS